MLPRLIAIVLLALSATSAAAEFRDNMAQRTLACTQCHGKEGRAGPDGYYPRLAGKPAGYLYNQLLNFREGRRHYGLMVSLLDPLSDEYLLEIAQYFASLAVPYPSASRSRVPRAELARGELLARKGDAASKVPACVLCHGNALTGMQPAIPGLVGLPRDYLNAQLGAWRTGQRRAHPPDCMADIANRLTPADVQAVTAWLAAQSPPAHSDPAPRQALPREFSCGSARPPAGRAGQ